MIAPSGKIFFTVINNFFPAERYSEWEEGCMFSFCSRHTSINMRGKSLKNSTLEEENVVYISKIISHSFTISAEKDSVFGCSNYLYWISCLAIFSRRTRRKQSGFIYKSETRNRKNY